MYSEDALLPISALQHLLFCRRQCALIHIEGLWAENRLTIEGQILHKRAHDAPGETRGKLRTCRGLALRSLRLGLIGKSDIVTFEFPTIELADAWRLELQSARSLEEEAFSFASAERVRVTPVEYKRGRPKADDSDRVQLAAQALCLEEMLGVEVRVGALYYGTRRRRTEVAIDDELRTRVIQAAAELHDMIASRQVPRAAREPKCENCSLIELCLPDAVGATRAASVYLRRVIAENMNSSGPSTDPFDVAFPPIGGAT